MKALALAFGLIALALNSSALAVCITNFVIPDNATVPSDREVFDHHTREQFGEAEIVAEAKVINISESTQMQWNSSQLVEVSVSRYLRAPSTKQIHDRYHITAAPYTLHKNDLILFFARAESKAAWRDRMIPLDPRPGPTLETIWTHRIWRTQDACSNSIYQLEAPENAYLVQFARQLSNDKFAPATLTLSFQLEGLRVAALAQIPLKIDAIGGAKLSRTVSVPQHAISLDFPAGRYRLHWPELPGYRRACSMEYEKANCELDMVAGASVRVQIDYRPLAKVNLVPVSAAGTPINLLGELEWRRIDVPEPDLAQPNQTALQHFDVRVDQLNELNERDGGVIAPGRYQLYWVVKSYAPELKSYDTCTLLRAEKFPVRWRIGPGALANEHDIPAGYSVVLAEIPKSQLVDLEFTCAQKSGGKMTVSPRCADVYSVSISGRFSLKVAAFRGQQYQLEYGCYSCKPRLETSRKLMQADQDMVLELK